MSNTVRYFITVEGWESLAWIAAGWHECGRRHFQGTRVSVLLEWAGRGAPITPRRSHEEQGS